MIIKVCSVCSICSTFFRGGLVFFIFFWGVKEAPPLQFIFSKNHSKTPRTPYFLGTLEHLYIFYILFIILYLFILKNQQLTNDRPRKPHENCRLTSTYEIGTNGTNGTRIHPRTSFLKPNKVSPKIPLPPPRKKVISNPCTICTLVV